MALRLHLDSLVARLARLQAPKAPWKRNHVRAWIHVVILTKGRRYMAFVAAVILVYFAGNLPNFKEELQFCEYFAGVGNVWRAVSRIQMLLVDVIYPIRFGLHTVALLPKLKTRGRGKPDLPNRPHGPSVFDNMKWYPDEDWTAAPSSGLLKPKEEIPCDAAPISELATLPAAAGTYLVFADGNGAEHESADGSSNVSTQVEGQTGDEGAHKRLQPETHEKLSPEKKVQKSGEVESALTVAALDEKLKRPAPAREEKVSPEAKVAKAAQVQEEVDSQPTALETAAKDVSAQPSEPVTESQNALLLVAMQRITELEAKLKQQEEKQTKMTSFETPPPKTLHSMTPSSTTSAKTASAPDSQAVHMLSAGDETSEKNDTETNEDGAKAEEGKDLLEFPNGSKLMSHDALRMRLRRLCQKTKKGKSHVDEDTQSAYEKGGEEREWLEIALIEAISKVGADNRSHKALRDNQPVEPIKVATMKAITEEGLSPVLPELVKFMDAIHNKMMAVQSNLGKLEIEGDGATNPMTKELMKDWENVRLNLKAVFSSLAELKADIMLDEGSTSEKFLCLQPYGA
ncbi:Uncharacterized protein SCF082_LOCUS28334 [Durusdinium trenchii]|uniref:Uncharacterized protein n=1 Tax=Durusdinium trenchii TaxID=1381693 RepID=A0ABP0MJG8_9DINO